MTEPTALLANLVKRFRPQAAQDLRAIYQLHLTGDNGGLWHLTIADQKCQLTPGPAPCPDVTITISTNDWNQLLAGRLDGFSAYLAGRLRITGDLNLVTRLPSLFGL